MKFRSRKIFKYISKHCRGLWHFRPLLTDPCYLGHPCQRILQLWSLFSFVFSVFLHARAQCALQILLWCISVVKWSRVNLLAQFARCTAAPFSGDHCNVSRFGGEFMDRGRGGGGVQNNLTVNFNLADTTVWNLQIRILSKGDWVIAIMDNSQKKVFFNFKVLFGHFY